MVIPSFVYSAVLGVFVTEQCLLVVTVVVARHIFTVKMLQLVLLVVYKLSYLDNVVFHRILFIHAVA